MLLRTRSLVLFVVCAIAATWIPSELAADEPSSTQTRTYQVRMQSMMTMSGEGQSRKTNTDSSLSYTYKPKGQQTVVQMKSIALKMMVDGTTSVDVSMNAQQMKAVVNGEEEVTTFAEAGPLMREALEDNFKHPICEFTRGPNGEIEALKVVARPGAKQMVDQGMVAQVTLFHPPYYADRAQWSSATSMSLGGGGYVKGDLIYKRDSTEGGKEKFDVSGKLTNARFAVPGSPAVVKDVMFEVTGTQIYDIEKRSWTQGELEMKVAFDTHVNDASTGKTTGTIVASFNE